MKAKELKRNNLEIYNDFADEWWDPEAPRFRSLNRLTPFRLELIKELTGVLSSKAVADLGCGGGLIAVPLLREGVDVIGVDRSEASIIQAQKAALGAGQFMVGDLYQLPIESETIDVTLMIDVIDHLENFPLALSEANRILKPGGTLVVGTINRTWESKLLAIFLGESLGFIPKGTHDFNLFVKPTELRQAATMLGLKFICIEGEWPKFWSTILNRAVDFRRAKSTRLAYTCKFVKPQDEAN